MPEESIYEISLPTGETVKVASKSSTTTEVINNSTFTIAETDGPRARQLVSAWQSLDGIVIFVWDESPQGVFRETSDINITSDGTYSIEKMLPSGSSNRVDVRIVR